MNRINKKLLVVTLCFVVAMVPIIYYFPKIKELINTPEKLLQLFLTASGIASFSVQYIFISFAIFLAAALIDVVVLGWKNCAMNRLLFNRSHSTYGDIWSWMLSVISVFDFFTMAFSLGLFYVINSIIVKSMNISLLSQIPNPVLQVIILIFMSDIKHYAWHRFMHLKPFWELHNYHHSATEFNLITSARGHFLEKGFLSLFDAVVFALMGAPVHYFVIFYFIKEFYDMLLHSSINSNFGWLGKHILVSPNAHKIHHSIDQTHYNKNYGTLFVFWDKLFGTYLYTTDKIVIGIENSPYTKGFWQDMLIGIKQFFDHSVEMVKRFFSSTPVRNN